MDEQSAQFKRVNLSSLTASCCDVKKERNCTSTLCAGGLEKDNFVGTFKRGEIQLTVEENYSHVGDTRWRTWLRHCATSQKVVDSIPDVVIVIFH